MSPELQAQIGFLFEFTGTGPGDTSVSLVNKQLAGFVGPKHLILDFSQADRNGIEHGRLADARFAVHHRGRRPRRRRHPIGERADARELLLSLDRAVTGRRRAGARTARTIHRRAWYDVAGGVQDGRSPGQVWASWTRMAICTRLATASLVSRRDTCAFTVASLMNSDAAISALDAPEPTAVATSRSRSVSDARRSAAARRRSACSSLPRWASNVRVTDGAVTDADVWLYDEATKVAVIGDLATVPVPYFETACPDRWTAALDEVWALPFETAIPGHGAPLTRAGFDAYNGGPWTSVNNLK